MGISVFISRVRVVILDT